MASYECVKHNWKSTDPDEYETCCFVAGCEFKTACPRCYAEHYDLSDDTEHRFAADRGWQRPGDGNPQHGAQREQP